MTEQDVSQAQRERRYFSTQTNFLIMLEKQRAGEANKMQIGKNDCLPITNGGKYYYHFNTKIQNVHSPISLPI
jgi:hypothetical protein